MRTSLAQGFGRRPAAGAAPKAGRPRDAGDRLVIKCALWRVWRRESSGTGLAFV